MGPSEKISSTEALNIVRVKEICGYACLEVQKFGLFENCQALSAVYRLQEPCMITHTCNPIPSFSRLSQERGSCTHMHMHTHSLMGCAERGVVGRLELSHLEMGGT